MKMKITLLVTGLVAAFALALSPPPPAAEGQTPDGETPAEEDICSAAGFTGAAWGLCNAYCEAMDCDGAPEATPEACAKVKANFEKKTGGKIALPCESVICNKAAPGLVLNGVDWAGKSQGGDAVVACVAQAEGQGCDNTDSVLAKICKGTIGELVCGDCSAQGEPKYCADCADQLELNMLNEAKCKFMVKACTEK